MAEALQNLEIPDQTEPADKSAESEYTEQESLQFKNLLYQFNEIDLNGPDFQEPGKREKFLSWMQGPGVEELREYVYSAPVHRDQLWQMICSLAAVSGIDQRVQELLDESVSASAQLIVETSAVEAPMSYAIMLRLLHSSSQFAARYRYVFEETIWPAMIAEFRSTVDTAPLDFTYSGNLESVVLNCSDKLLIMVESAIAEKVLAFWDSSAPQMVARWLKTRNSKLHQAGYQIIIRSLSNIGVDGHKFHESASDTNYTVLKNDDHVPNPAWEETVLSDWRADVELEKWKTGSVAKLRALFGIQHPGRYPRQMLQEQLTHKEERPMDKAEYVQKYPRRHGIILVATADHSGNFLRTKDIWEGLGGQMQPDGRLDIYECSDQLEAIAALNDARHGDGKLDFAILGGHANKTLIQLAASAKPTSPPQFNYLSSHDLKRPGFTAVRNAFKEDSSLVLVACETGSPGALAQQLSRELEMIVVAPDQVAGLSDIKLEDNPDGPLRTFVEYRHARAAYYENGLPTAA